MTKLTATQANELVLQAMENGTLTADYLKNHIIAKLDTSAPGGATMTYSGGMAGSPSSTPMSDYFAQNSNLKLLNNSEAFKFLQVFDGNPDVPVNLTLIKALDTLFPAQKATERHNEANNFLFGATKDADGNRIPERQIVHLTSFQKTLLKGPVATFLHWYQEQTLLRYLVLLNYLYSWKTQMLLISTAYPKQS